jgi:peroxiredoxin
MSEPAPTGQAPAANYLDLPAGLPAPEDDGAARHLRGMRMPHVVLPGTDGSNVDLGALDGLTVIYFYPRTGEPGRALPDGWDAIPGARGCTPQSCAFRDHFADLQALGVRRIFGISTQDTAYQGELADRLHLPFALLSDADLRLQRALDLPTFEVDGMILLKRLTIIVQDGIADTVFYPVFPPNRNAEDVVGALSGRR